MPASLVLSLGSIDVPSVPVNVLIVFTMATTGKTGDGAESAGWWCVVG